jgi:23S rRNA pseudouridine1911/1915/1917 synthase
MPKKPRWTPDRTAPSRSGADTPRSTDIVSHGGKVDPDALLRRIRAAQADAPPGASDPDAADLVASLPDDPDQAALATAPDNDDAPSRVVFVLQRDLDKRLDKYLCDRIPFMSRSQLQRLIDEGGVTVNARAPKSSTRLRAGDRVEVYVPPPPPTDIQPEHIPLDVLYEDDALIVINKAPDIIVHPARSHNSGTMINALAWHFQNASPAGGSLSKVGTLEARPGVVHRLDRHTSGLILFAKTDEAHWRLGQQFENRTVDKRYLALVHGVYEPPVDAIDLPIGPHPSREKGYREKQVVRHDHLGKPALTIARVRWAFADDADEPAADPAHAEPVPATAAGWKPALSDPASRPSTRSAPIRGHHALRPGFSLLELELKTGRTHQIRVHLSHRGYPIVGDDMYDGLPLYAAPGAALTLDRPRDLEPGQSVPPEQTVINRQALHATTLRFRHPTDNRQMNFVAPLRDDMRRAITALRAACPRAALLHPPGSAVDVDSVLRAV